MTYNLDKFNCIHLNSWLGVSITQVVDKRLFTTFLQMTEEYQSWKRRCFDMFSSMFELINGFRNNDISRSQKATIPWNLKLNHFNKRLWCQTVCSSFWNRIRIRIACHNDFQKKWYCFQEIDMTSIYSQSLLSCFTLPWHALCYHNFSRINGQDRDAKPEAKAWPDLNDDLIETDFGDGSDNQGTSVRSHYVEGHRIIFRVEIRVGRGQSSRVATFNPEAHLDACIVSLDNFLSLNLKWLSIRRLHDDLRWWSSIKLWLNQVGKTLCSTTAGR